MDALDESKEAIRFELLRGIERFHKQVTLSLMVTQRTEAMELDYGDVTYDICRTSPIKIYYRCNICGDGLYDVCLECRNKGRSCLDESHEPLEPNYEVFMEIRLKDPEITAYVKWEINNELNPGSSLFGPTASTNSKTRTRFGRLYYEHPRLQNDIPDKVVARANGMILLANLFMDSLKAKQNLQQIMDTLETLPEEVDSNYDKIMERINGQSAADSSLARRVLSWIVYTHRPLSLVELQHALAVRSSDTDFNSAEVFDKDLLLSITAGLVSVDLNRLAVRLVHLTAQEFFDKNRARYFPNAAVDIAAVSLTYLSFESFSEPCQDPRETEGFKARLEMYPFLNYASQYWGMHVNEAGDDSTIQDAVLQFVNFSGQLASTTQATFYLDSSWDLRKGVHACAWFGLDATIRKLASPQTDPRIHVDSPDPAFNQTTLMYACRRGHISTVPTLLELDADVNNCSTRESTALFEAIQEGLSEIVKI